MLLTGMQDFTSHIVYMYIVTFRSLGFSWGQFSVSKVVGKDAQVNVELVYHIRLFSLNRLTFPSASDLSLFFSV